VLGGGKGRFRFEALAEIFKMSPRKPPAIKPFSAAKEVKRRARVRVGTPPPTQRHESRKRRPPKHKKEVWEVDEGMGPA
jgi:hypothetical protein